jgi:hypothetical protein
MADEKKGFGAKLKGVGKAIGRQLKKVPGVAYRDVVKPYAQHMADKFTEPVVSKPTLRRETLPGSAALSKAYRTGVEPYKAEERTTKATRPGGPFPSGAVAGTPTGLKRGAGATVEPFKAQQRTKVKRKPGADRTTRIAAQYKTSGGAKGVPIPRPGETLQSASYKSRIAKEKAAERKAAREAALKPKVGKGRTKTTDLTAGTRVGEVVTVIGEMPRDKPPGPPTTKGMTRAKPKRKFSPKRTGATLTKAAKARREEIAAYTPPDTTAQEMARMMTEQDIAREAQRTETELKKGRKPQREKARYRYRTRGLKRSEGRGR